jgi:hypothetical protein
VETSKLAECRRALKDHFIVLLILLAAWSCRRLMVSGSALEQTSNPPTHIVNAASK